MPEIDLCFEGWIRNAKINSVIVAETGKRLNIEEVDAQTLCDKLMDGDWCVYLENYRLVTRGNITNSFPSAPKERIPGSATDDLANKFIQVEYDPSFWGGDYSKVGAFALIPLDLIKRLSHFGENDVEEAFRQTTGVDPVHIVHYSPDYLYDAEGNEIDEDEEDNE